MFETLTVFGTFLFTQFTKQYISPKWGDSGVHLVCFLTAFFIISVRGFIVEYPPLGEMLLEAGKYLVASLALYKVLLKPINENFNLF